jgi:predicted ester cyclase
MAFSNSVGTLTDGEWLGQKPNGNKLDYKVVDIFRIQDGMIAEHWDVADTMAMARQLGTVERFLAGPPPKKEAQG